MNVQRIQDIVDIFPIRSKVYDFKQDRFDRHISTTNTLCQCRQQDTPIHLDLCVLNHLEILEITNLLTLATKIESFLLLFLIIRG